MGVRKSEVQVLFGQAQSYAALIHIRGFAAEASELLALLVPGDMIATRANLEYHFRVVGIQHGNVALQVFSRYVQGLRKHLEHCHVEPVLIPLADIYLLARSRNRAVQLAA